MTASRLGRLRVLLGLWSVVFVGGMAGLLGTALAEAGAPSAMLLITGAAAAACGIAVVVVSRGPARARVGRESAAQNRRLTANAITIAAGLLATGLVVTFLWVPVLLKWLLFLYCACLAAGGGAAALVRPATEASLGKPIWRENTVAPHAEYAAAAEAHEAGPRLVRVYTNENRTRAWSATLGLAAALVGSGGLAYTVIAGVNLGVLIFYGAFAAALATAALLLPTASESEVVLGFTGEGVSVVGSRTGALAWKAVERVDLQTSDPSLRRYRILSLRFDSPDERELRLHVRRVSAEAMGAILTELLAHCPASAIDIEVPALDALTSSVIARNRRVATQVNTLVATDSVLHGILKRQEPQDASVTAPFEYFLGNIDKARAHCAAGLSLESNAWDLLLCRALCERSLGDEAAYRESLRAALEASPPPEVAPVLAHALELA